MILLNDDNYLFTFGVLECIFLKKMKKSFFKKELVIDNFLKIKFIIILLLILKTNLYKI